MKKISLFLCLGLCGCFPEIDQQKAHMERRQAYVNQRPQLAAQTKQDILGGTIRMGMDQDDVVASLGDPIERNRTVTAFGAHEQWIYCSALGDICKIMNDFRHRIYIYFDNGKLTSWQDSH